MNIQEALEKGNGKAMLASSDDKRFYAAMGRGEEELVLYWWEVGALKQRPVSYNAILDGLWQPYEEPKEETEKCKYCQMADEIEGKNHINEGTLSEVVRVAPFNYTDVSIARHLREDHCVCEGKA